MYPESVGTRFKVHSLYPENEAVRRTLCHLYSELAGSLQYTFMNKKGLLEYHCVLLCVSGQVFCSS